MNIYITSIGSSIDNYNKTIKNKVNLNNINKYYEIKDKSLKDFHIWGIPSLNNYNFYKNDILIFVNKNFIISYGTIYESFNSNELSNELWNDVDENKDFSKIILIDNLINSNFSIFNFNKIVKYGSGYRVRKFSKLNNEAAKEFIDKFLLIDEDFQKIIESRFGNNYLESRLYYEVTDKKVLTKIRLEQYQLRKNLFKDLNHQKCCICNKTFPVDFLIASHIKDRKDCILEERNDLYRIVAPMCVFGCDFLYGQKMIYVNIDGKVKINFNNLMTDSIKEYMLTIEDNIVENYKISKNYFDFQSEQIKIHK
ncbi:hypothetical protein [Spiroplasma turonicum]|uniref:Uncharacterized protein n=1 Tax=Spiroplasma turonicum TaxID=216946 RepID=A0A0K1P6B2_9MOLU|nr:hypothetical protein [Spiroplasma turonicum]AKU79810.1 hypothetical protein STURON_00564 [Spiroplasma turonicum]ALX70828.1 hypothetical protein STURO_v1c05620 [Spiroplasma turonicum]